MRKTHKMKGGSDVNVLYLGMATDIITAMALVPNFTKLYAINMIDDAYGTWSQQKDYIKRALTEGNDSAWLEPVPEDERVVTELEPSEILDEDDDPWRLTFIYEGKKRELVYYEMDFEKTWPKAVDNINHVMMMGSFRWSQFAEEASATIIKMFEERTKSPWIYALTFNHRKFTHHTRQEFQEVGRTISKIHFDKLTGDWWKKDYS